MSVGEQPTLEAMMEQLLAYPAAPYVEYDVRPLLGVDAAIGTALAAYRAVAAPAA